MRPNVKQVLADKRRMEEYVAKRIPVDEIVTIELATGMWADLYSTWDAYFGWVLEWETNEPEWVDIWEIYDHFRVQETTWTEWSREIDRQLARWKVRKLERENSAMGYELNHVRQTNLEMDPQMRTGSAISLISALPDLATIAKSLARIADVVDPPPPDKVDTAYVAKKLGIGLARVSQMASGGEIPPSCIVAGTGNGKVWKFHRVRIDEWIDNGRT